MGVLLPHLAGVIVEAVTAAAGLLLVTSRARAPEAACPKCGDRVGPGPQPLCQDAGRRRRRGRPVAIVLAVRRFFCAAPACPRKTFAEQVDGLTTRYARKTPLLAGMLGSIAVARDEHGRQEASDPADGLVQWQVGGGNAAGFGRGHSDTLACLAYRARGSPDAAAAVVAAGG